jgi:CRISPR-associated protein Cas1
MDLSDIQKNYPEISASANDVLGLLGLRFTNKTGGHVETDISAAASLAGLSGTQKITTELNTWLNKAVNYQEKDVSWNYVIFLKTRELAHHLIGKKKTLDLVSPEYQIERPDSDEVRKKILSIPYALWKKRGFSKGTLNYMKKNAESDKPFTLNKHVRERVDQWNNLVKVNK